MQKRICAGMGTFKSPEKLQIKQKDRKEKMTLQTDNLMIYDFVNPIVQYINSFIARLVPEMQIPFVIAVSLFSAYWIKHKNNWNNYSFVGMAVIIFAGLRYFGIG